MIKKNLKFFTKNLGFKSLPSIQVTEKRSIGDDQPCFITAEVGQNHNGDMAIAKKLLDTIATYRPDAMKLCKRHIPSDLTRAMYNQPYISRHSFGETYGKHREFLELSIEQYMEIKEDAQKKGLIFFSTVCDTKSVDDLEKIDVPLYKVASRDITNLPLLNYIAQTDKPIILSCGMDLVENIKKAINTIRRYHNKIVLLQCTSLYPTEYEDVNLRVMHTLRKEFDVLVGLSDHSRGVMTPVVAAALGAVMVEKHVTFNRNSKGTDHAGSLGPDGLRRVVRDIRNMEKALGDGIKQVPNDIMNVRAKLSRSLVSKCKISKGARLTEDIVCLKSPGTGLTWHERNKIIGKTARRDIPADVTLLKEDFE